MTDSAFSQGDGDPRLDAAISDYLEAQARGQVLDTEQFLAKYPGLEEPLREFLENHQAVALALTGPSDADPPEHRRYEVYQVLNRGGMGVIWRCRDRVLGRELAVKTLRRGLQGQPEIVARFEEEAQIGSQLQHPGIPPVYDLDRLPNGQPFFTMKLIEGRNLAELLAERKSPGEELPRFLGIFQQVCQTVAYAHDRKVLHRDLKPANIMVGAFGEVQVMDWGLGKVLTEPAEAAASRPAAAESGPPPAAEVETVRTRAADAATSADTVLGTYRYMPPEQARAGAIDQRSDVFGLGAILCEILTGLPPYTGTTKEELIRQAKRPDLAEAFARLATCGADPDLLNLTKACLAAEPDQRPAGAAVVAHAITTYLNSVQEALRQADLARAAAEARATEEAQTREVAQAKVLVERRARRLAVGLAAATVLLTAAAAGAWWLNQQREARIAEIGRLEEKTASGTQDALNEWQRNKDLALRAPLKDLGRLFEAALASARKANVVARSGPASEETRREAQAALSEATSKLDANLKDSWLLTKLRNACEIPDDRLSAKLGFVAPSIAMQFRQAFREWGLDLDRMTSAEATARIRARPAAVVLEIVAALDEWAFQERADQPESRWSRLINIANAVDGADPRRRELRGLLTGGRLLPVGAGKGRSAAKQPEQARARDVSRLRELARTSDPATDPVLSLRLLTQSLQVAGEEDQAEALLRKAVHKRPSEVLLLESLAFLLHKRAFANIDWAFFDDLPLDSRAWEVAARQLKAGAFSSTISRAPKLQHAAEYMRAARALRPESRVKPGLILTWSDRPEEGYALLREAVQDRPDDLMLSFVASYNLLLQGKFSEGSGLLRKSLLASPKDAEARGMAVWFLGFLAMFEQKWGEAERAMREVTLSQPDFAGGYEGLADILEGQGKLTEALVSRRRVVELQPRDQEAKLRLALTLVNLNRLPEAETICQEIIPVSQGYVASLAHCLWSKMQVMQDRPREAETAARKALAIRPKFAEAHALLGAALLLQKRVREAQEACQRALQLDPDLAAGHAFLGASLALQGHTQDGMAALKQAIVLAPKLAAPHEMLGAVYLAENKLPEAEAAFKRAVELEPSSGSAHLALGGLYAHTNRLGQAEAPLKRAATLQPTSMMPHVILGALYGKQNRWNEAERAAREAIRLQPKDPDQQSRGKVAEAYSLLGAALSMRGQYPEAEDACRRALQFDANSAQAHNMLGASLVGQGKPREAEAPLQKAILLDPRLAPAHEMLGVAFEFQKRLAEAEASYQRAVKLQPATASAQLALGRAYAKQDKWKEAESPIRRAILHGPENPEAHLWLARSLAAQRKFPEAEMAFGTVLRLKPDHPRAYLFFGSTLAAQNKNAEAQKLFQKHISFRPTDPDGYSRLANLLLVQGKSDEAESTFRKVIELRPNDADTQEALGAIQYLFRAKPAEALPFLRKAIAINPARVESHYLLGLALREQGELAEAEKALRQADRLRPKHRPTLEHLAKILSARKDWPAAEAMFRQLIALNPDDFEAQLALCGVLTRQESKLAEAEPILRKLTTLRPDNPGAQGALALVLTLQGRWADAEKAWRKGISLAPDDPFGHSELGRALKEQGKFADALTAFRRAQKLGSGRPNALVPSAKAVKETEHLAELDAKLPGILRDDVKPGGSADLLALGEICAVHRKHYVAAVRFYADAFAIDSRAETDLTLPHRYNAACAAALASSGAGEGGAGLDARKRAEFRDKALTWLRAHLTACQKEVGKKTPAAMQSVHTKLTHWKRDTDLVPVRERTSVAKLPAEEANAWRQFWADVDALLDKTRATAER